MNDLNLLIVDDDRDLADALATMLTLKDHGTAVAYIACRTLEIIADFDA